MKKLKVTQIRSAIDRPKRQKDTIRCLGITKLHNPREHNDTPQIRGMVKAVAHLVVVEEI